MNNSKNKPMQQVPGGQFDNFGFYHTPDGSFWDPDGIHFNSEGLDSHGGYYSESLEYCPGPGWIEELMCYEDEKQEVLKGLEIGGRKNDARNEEDFDDEGDVNDIYEELDFDKLLNLQNDKFDDVDLNKEAKPEPEKKKVYNPKNAMNMNTNINQYKNNVITSVKEENEKEIPEKKEEMKITPDMLFNKIPDNLKPKNIDTSKENKQIMTKVEKKIEIDSLFG